MAEAKKTTKTKKTEEVVEPAESIVEAVAEATPETEEAPAEEKKTAKAGKRSAKAVKETEEKQAKEERKTEATTKPDAKPKAAQKPARSRLERRGKKFREAAKLIDKDKSYALKEAMELAVKASPVKFDASVELHIRLGVDPKQADQNLRDTVVLPAGTGKTARVAVVSDDPAAAKAAGADISGGDDFLAKLDKGELDFDILVATPAMMPKLGKYARVLGPKGLMPNPKSGTVTNDIKKAVSEAKAGRVEYRVDSTGIIHTGIGKVSFGPDKLEQNARAILASIKANKPSSLKGNYVLSIYSATSMGPSIKVASSEL